MSSLDFSALTDDQLVELIRAALQEAVRRGSAVEAAVRDAGLDEAEKARIAKEAAEREARKLAEEEARRVAAAAADKVRREAERQKEQAAIDERAKIRAIAVRARELFGSDVTEFKVEVWSRAGDKRVYIGHGYDDNWIAYYHTGTNRQAPGTLEVLAPRVVTDLATHLGISRDEAKARIKGYCADLCTDWKTLKVEVTEGNAPRDPHTLVDRWILQSSGGGFYGKQTRGGVRTAAKDEADRFPTEESARGEIPKYVGPEHWHLDKSPEAVKVLPIQVRLAFAPKEVARA